MNDAVSVQHGPSRAEHIAMLGRFSATSVREGAVHSIGLFGELDLATVDAAEAELTSAEASNAAAIVVDLSGLSFIGSAGVCMLFRATTRSRNDSERLTLLRGPAAVQRVLQLTGIEDQLPFAD